jgi:hypothetical protein
MIPGIMQKGGEGCPAIQFREKIDVTLRQQFSASLHEIYFEGRIHSAEV